MKARTYIFTVDYQIGDQSVLLRVAFNYVACIPATGPTWSCGGTPEVPAEVDIISLDWSRDNKLTRTYQWHPIEGALFELIGEDDYLALDLLDKVDAVNEPDPDRAYDERREERFFG